MPSLPAAQKRMGRRKREEREKESLREREGEKRRETFARSLAREKSDTHRSQGRREGSPAMSLLLQRRRRTKVKSRTRSRWVSSSE